MKGDSSCKISNIESCVWLKNSKTALKLQKNDEKYFQYAIILLQNHEKLVNYPIKIKYQAFHKKLRVERN